MPAAVDYVFEKLHGIFTVAWLLGGKNMLWHEKQCRESLQRHNPRLLGEGGREGLVAGKSKSFCC